MADIKKTVASPKGPTDAELQAVMTPIVAAMAGAALPHVRTRSEYEAAKIMADVVKVARGLALQILATKVEE